MKLYGIPNCGTVKKARVWLDEHGIDYEFHDFKKQGVTESLLSDWLRQVGWQKLLKKTGPTWGQLPDTIKASIKDDTSALALMLEKPNVIKRPVLESKGKVLATGFSGRENDVPAEYENLLARSPLPNPLPQAGEGANE
jgi:Spx/MgsR family transcriptional regulator